VPSTTNKQRRFMRAAAKNPKFAKKAGIKQSVAKEFYAADRRARYAVGGGVLGAFGRASAPRIRPYAPPDIPAMVGAADRAISRAGKLRMRARGGRSV
jgi:hypothetical protein